MSLSGLREYGYHDKSYINVVLADVLRDDSGTGVS